MGNHKFLNPDLSGGVSLQFAYTLKRSERVGRGSPAPTVCLRVEMVNRVHLSPRLQLRFINDTKN